ncbi:methyltransferase protein 7B-like, partial [Tropilaelaps mercedesae]
MPLSTLSNPICYRTDIATIQAICHSKGSISEPVDVRLNVDNINLTLATQERLQSNTDLDELRILEVCVNPILTSNYKHFPYYSQNTIISDKRNYSSIGDLNSLRKFSDASFDAVVVTLMLCNSRDIDNHIQHIYRILVQGGHIYFLEHEPNCSDSPNDGNIDKSVLSFTSFGTLNSFFTWLRPPAKSQ